MAHELRKAGFQITQQANATVVYDGVIVGNYIADIVVENTILMEIKAVRALDKFHGAQCLNYLRTTGLRCVRCSTLAIRDWKSGDLPIVCDTDRQMTQTRRKLKRIQGSAPTIDPFNG
jgi:hypothetical protein